jgi:hypothetical protein
MLDLAKIQSIAQSYSPQELFAATAGFKGNSSI